MLEGYITPLLMSYIDKYIKNIKPSDLQVSFWGGDAVLRNLELRLDVLEKELDGFPLEILSGKIRELTMHLPWNAIASTSAEITIQDLELVVKMKNMRSKSNWSKPQPTDSVDSDTPTVKRSSSAGAPNEQSGYLQGYINRIINNGQLHVKRMVVKVIEEQCDLMLTFNIGSLEGYTTDEHWERKYIYTDYLKDNYSLYKECAVCDMTVNLHPIEGLGEVSAKTSSHEPFVQRSAFHGRMKMDYRGNMLVKKSVEVLFDTPVNFQVNENQFCLFFHIIDWLLAAYYSTKRLKGESDPPIKPDPPPTSSVDPTPTTTEPETVSQTNKPQAGNQVTDSSQEKVQPSSGKGWGSWMFSLMTTPEDSGSQEELGNTPTMDGKLIVPSSSYAMTAETVNVTLHITNKTPFKSTRMFTSPVLHFHFTGCTNKLESAPQSKLFLYTLGIMSVEASVSGMCPCVSKFPTSWQKTDTLGMTEPSEKIPAFSSGKHPLHSAALSRELLRGSLFDPAQTTTSTVNLPPATKEEVAQAGQAFKSLWISYLYLDKDEVRTKELCFERIAIGRTKMAISSDVTHRLHHFWSAYSQSMEANPSASKGKVIRGDPAAVTNFDIEFAGGHMIFTPNAHFIPISRQSKPNKRPPPLPALCTTCDKLHIAILQPMYSRNASPDTPQKVHTVITHDCLTAGIVMVKCLSDVLKEWSCDAELVLKQPKNFFHFAKCGNMPQVEIKYNSTSTGDDSLTTSNWQLDIAEVSCIGTLKQLEHFLFIYSGWFFGEPLSSRAEISPRKPLPLNIQLYGVMKKVTYTRSFHEKFFSTSAILSEVSMFVVRDGTKIPVFHGPMNTCDWNTIDSYASNQNGSQQESKEKLVEFFISIPHKSSEDELFPVLRLEASGCVLSLELSLMEFLKLLPVDALTPVNPSQAVSESHSVKLEGSQHTPHTPSHSLSSTDSVEAGTAVQGVGLWSRTKQHEIMMKTSPILIVLPSQEELTTPPTHPLLFPRLAQLANQVSGSSSPDESHSALLFSLPGLALQSARASTDTEVVEREGRPDSLPWDSQLASLAVFTVIGNQASYLLEPVAVKATLTPQQEGSGVTVNSDTVTMSLSRQQVELLCKRLSQVIQLANSLSVSVFATPSKDCEHNEQEGSLEDIQTPSHLSPPTLTPSTTLTSSNATHTDTVCSIANIQGVSALRVHVLVPKFIMNLYTRDLSNQSSLLATSLQGVGGLQHDHTVVAVKDKVLNSPNGALTRLSIEADGASLEIDVQEKSTDIVLQLAALESSLYKQSRDGNTHAQTLHPSNQWMPCIDSSNGKLFSSTSSILPQNLSQCAATGLLPWQQPTSPGTQSNFVLVTIKVPQEITHDSVKLSCTVGSFELCAWLPVIGHMLDIASPIIPHNTPTKKPSEKKGSLSLSLTPWPQLDVHLENFRIIFPDSSYFHTLILSTVTVCITSCMDLPDVVDPDTFKRLTELPQENKQSPLPVYQMDLCGVGLEAHVRGERLQSMICVSPVDMEMVYSSPFSLTPPSQHKETMGQCLELNVVSDVTLFLGADQLKCVLNIFKANTPFYAKAEVKEEAPLPPDSGTEKGKDSTIFPSFKLMLSGKTVGVSFLNTHVTSHDVEINKLYQSQRVIPLFHILVQNPFLSLQISDNCFESELSCFNMAALYTDHPTPLAYPKLISVNSVTSLFECELLDTQRGQLSTKPSTLLTVNYSSQGENGAGRLVVDAGRPIKISTSSGFIKRSVEFVLEIEKTILLLVSSDASSSNNSQDSQERDTKISNQSNQSSSIFSLSNIFNSQISVSTSQILFELKLPTLPVSQPVQHKPVVDIEDSLIHKDTVVASLSVTPAIQEGLVAGWNNLSLTIPQGQSGSLCINGVQLLSVYEGIPGFIISPLQLQCALRKHSTHDLAQTSLEISCGLLEMFLSPASLGNILQATSLFSESTKPLWSKLNTSQPTERPQTKQSTVETEENVMTFSDDLRSGDFKYVTDECSDDPRMPAAGEIVFGDHTMTWGYPEQRVITSLIALPVPFSVTSNAPIKVKCDLQYWLEEESCFSTQTSFTISETDTTELSLSDHTVHTDQSQSGDIKSLGSCSPARVWRVILRGLVSGEEDAVFSSITEILDGCGQALPLSAVISPVSLAASLRVNSLFSPSFLPVLTFSLSCPELCCMLLHQSSVKQQARFKGYRIVPCIGPQELLRMNMREALVRAKLGRRGEISAKVGGVVSMDYVDFGDLVWRTAAYPTTLSGGIEFKQNTETCPPDSKSLSISLTSSPALLRVSQGLVHTSSLAAHVWLNSGLETSKQEEHSNREPEENRSRTCNNGVHPGSQLLNYYIICNDTMEVLHIRQLSVDEDVIIPSGCCSGYSWSSRVTSPCQLQLRVGSMEDWHWTDSFSIDTPGVAKMGIDLGGHTATVFVRVTQLGGLQKQVTFFGYWKLFSTLPFSVEIQLYSDDSHDHSTSKVLTLCQERDLPSIVATESQVSGVRIRIEGGRSWSRVYPLNTGSSNRPQLLAEFPDEEGSTSHCWYNVKPLDYFNNQPWGTKISLSPLFAVSNLSPLDLTMTLSHSQTASPLPTLAQTSQQHFESLALSKGETTALSSTLKADEWYSLTFQSRESTESSSSLSLSTQLLHTLPFSDADSQPPPISLSLPLGSNDLCTIQASYKRTPLNTITVYLRSKARLVNHTSCQLQLICVAIEDDEKAKKTSEVSPHEEALLHYDEFVLGVDWCDTLLCSKPITESSLITQDSKDGNQRLLCLSEVYSETGSDSEKVIAEFLLSSESLNASITSTVRPAYVLHNSTKYSLWIKSVKIMGKVNQELLRRVHKNTNALTLEVKKGQSEPIIFWSSLTSSRKGQGALTQAICMTATDDKASIESWSIFLSPKFVRHSFSLPTYDNGLTHQPHLLTRHEFEGTIYLVVSEDPFPRYYFQNLCTNDLEVVECGTSGVNAFPQFIPSGCEVAYEPPSVAKLYPLVFDEESSSEAERELKVKADNTLLKIRRVSGNNSEQFPWSSPFPLAPNEEKILSIPELEMVFVSIDKRGCTNTQSIIPMTSSPLSNISLPDESKFTISVQLSVKLEQMIACVDDEVSDVSVITELLRLYGDNIELHYTMSHGKGPEVTLSMQSCQVDNKFSTEYEVAMIPHSEHIPRRSIMETEALPVAKLQINFNPHSVKLIDKLQISTQPVTIQLEDNLLQHIKSLMLTYLPPGVLSIKSSEAIDQNDFKTTPATILEEAERDVSPLFIASLIIEPISFFLSASITLKVFISCNNTPFNFSEYRLENIYSTFSELFQLVGARYVSSAFMNAGWVLGSLEILGSPGTLIRSVGRGLRDLIVLPYQGLSHSPGMFVLGLGQGAASFVQNVSMGALSSVTNLASSMSRNMEQLSMDPDHASYQEQIRRRASASKFSAGVQSGMSSFGLSLISAVAGIVDQPMQSFQKMEDDSTPLETTKSILAGVGKGILGVVTKPMGGAMELVSKTGQGIMHGTGLARSLTCREVEVSGIGTIYRQELPSTILKHIRNLNESHPFLAVTVVSKAPSTQQLVIIMTPTKLHLLDLKSDTMQQSLLIRNFVITEHTHSKDQVELHFKHCTHMDQEQAENHPQMGPTSTKEKSLISNDFTETKKEGSHTNTIDCTVYLTTPHQAAHFLTLYHHTRQALLEPESRFL